MGALAEWRKQKWVRIGTDGGIKGPCGTSKNKNNPNFDIKVDATVSDRSHQKSDSKIMSASPL